MCGIKLKSTNVRITYYIGAYLNLYLCMNEHTHRGMHLKRTAMLAYTTTL
jgi:hypothetical protein